MLFGTSETEWSDGEDEVRSEVEVDMVEVVVMVVQFEEGVVEIGDEPDLAVETEDVLLMREEEDESERELERANVKDGTRGLSEGIAEGYDKVDVWPVSWEYERGDSTMREGRQEGGRKSGVEYSARGEGETLDTCLTGSYARRLREAKLTTSEGGFARQGGTDPR